MIKMKKNLIRGATALSLAAVMSITLVTPVWAATDQNTTPSGGETPKIESFHVYETQADQTGTITIAMDNPASYTVSLPKTVTFSPGVANLAGNTHTYDFTVLYDLGATQVMKITAGHVTLKNKGGSGSTSKVLNATIDSTNSNVLTIDAATDNKITTPATHSCTLTNASNIYAGNWSGTQTFTVNVTTEANGGS